MPATVSGTGNLELIQKHNFRSLRAQIVYTHYRKKIKHQERSNRQFS